MEASSLVGAGTNPAGTVGPIFFVAPSINEPFGLVFLEAMAGGLPVITTTTGGPLSFVNTVPGKPNGWSPPRTTSMPLPTALAKVVNDDKR